MNIIGCLDRPTDGQYRFAGQDVAEFDRDQLEPFFGQDRIDLLRWRLEQHGLQPRSAR